MTEGAGNIALRFMWVNPIALTGHNTVAYGVFVSVRGVRREPD